MIWVSFAFVFKAPVMGFRFGLQIRSVRNCLSPRGHHLCYSPAQRKKFSFAGVSSEKMNALPPKKSPKTSPKTNSGFGQFHGPRPLPQSPIIPTNPIGQVFSLGPSAAGPAQSIFPLNEELSKVPMEFTRTSTGLASDLIPAKKK